MGKKRLESEIEAIRETVKRYPLESLYDGPKKCFVSKDNTIWNDISKELLLNCNCSISKLRIYTAVSKNYYDLWNVLQLYPDAAKDVESICEEVSFDNLLCSDSTNIDSNDSEEGYVELLGSTYEFNICLTWTEYSQFDVSIVKHKRNDKSVKQTQHYLEHRDAQVLKNSNWTNVIHKKLIEKSKLQCTFIFKRHKISPSGPQFLQIFGVCKECNSKIKCVLFNEPNENESLELDCTVQGNFSKTHSLRMMRPLRGDLRSKFINKMTKENYSASRVQSMIISSELETGKIMPKLSTLRAAKCHEEKAKYINEKPIVSLQEMRNMQEFSNVIRNIGYSPFFVFFWSNSQLLIYRQYCKQNYSRIAIDATGTVVKRIVYTDGSKSSHIFLYDIVILYPNRKQYSVGSMLSASQNTEEIMHWLSVWFRSAGCTPSEVVTDMSLALMHSCANTFTSFKNLNEYIEQCYNVLFKSGSNDSKCFLRFDVAHFIKLVSRWPSLRNQHKITRNFYLRCMGQVIQCQDISDLESLLNAIFAVAYSDTEGDCNDYPTFCEVNKQWLIQRISTGTVEFNTIISMEDLIEEENEEKHAHDKEVEENKKGKNSFESWCKSISQIAKSKVNTPEEIGNRGNQQVLPSFVDDFLKIANFLPVWSSIMCKHFPHSPRIGSSASAESNFNYVKHRIFAHKKLPLRVDEFVAEYVRHYEGAIKLAEYNMGEKSEAQVKPSEQILQNLELENKVSELVPEKTNKKLNSSEMPDNTCASCQLGIGSAMIECKLCKLQLHKNDNCTVLYEENILCKQCYVRGTDENALSEKIAEESWMGMNVPPKKRARKSYLEPHSEMAIVDWTRKRVVTTIGLLRNGNIVHLNPIKVSNKLISLRNTCGIDALTQIFCIGYCDSVVIKQYIERIKEATWFANLVAKVVNKGVNTHTYKTRAELLYMHFPKRPLPENIIEISCEDSITNIADRVLENFQLGIQRDECTNCKNVQNIALKWLSVEVNTVQELETKLNKTVSKLFIKKTCQICANNQFLRKINLDPTYLAIEPVAITNMELELKTSLDEIPPNLSIDEYKYILRGIVAFQGTAQPIPNSLGHFVTYGRRHNSKWEMYNDLLKSKEGVSPSRIVRCHFLVYSL